jgi:hypothetical protein
MIPHKKRQDFLNGFRFLSQRQKGSTLNLMLLQYFYYSGSGTNQKVRLEVSTKYSILTVKFLILTLLSVVKLLT